MNIAIMHCRKSQKVCTGAACFKAFNNNLKSFAQYQDEPTTLCAFMDCGGCGIDFEHDTGMLEKMERMQKEGVEKIHIALCINREKCQQYDDILALLDRFELNYECGTH